MNKHGKRKRDNGEGGLIKIEGSPYWYLLWRAGRVQHKKSSGTTVKQEALNQLRDKLIEARAGFQTNDPSKMMYENLREMFLNDYRENDYASLHTNKETGVQYVCGLNHLDDFFSGRKLSEITVDSIDRFKAVRKKAGASNGTINRSLAKLRRMFRLAAKRGKIRYVPAVNMLPEPKGRQGFLEITDYEKLRDELPEHVRPLLAVGFYTGMRLGEILNLRWFQVNVAENKITLESEDTKNAEPRIIPLIDVLPDLFEGIRRNNPDSEYVFLGLRGEPIQSFIKAWRSACVRAGIRVKIDGVEVASHFEDDGTYRGFLFHDLRRSAVRNFIRAGVPRSIAMKISGHRTESIFERYNITSEIDLQDAAVQVSEFLKKKRAKGKAARSPKVVPMKKRLRAVR